ncbi:hypothetical protein [Streptomyces sp. MMS24-I29]|uniref:hypothetical protein n=1 Tax=Streptomyces sp. MMS24-I29 TaxID=3351480 RepID=UPI003C7ACCAD
MANYSVSASQLTEGSHVLIRGKLAYGRLTRPIEGAELEASDQRKIQNGMSPVGKPHTTATLTEAEVVFADPANPTTEEIFVSERRYASQKNPQSGPNYSIDSKGTTLPITAIPSDKGDGTFDQDTSGRELAQGLDVTLVLRVYKPKNFANRGLALDQVIVNETPRYYNAGSVATSELAARGIVFNTPPTAMQASAGDATAGAAGAAAATEPVGTEMQDGLAFPAPQPTAPAAAPVAAAPTAVAPTAVAPTPATQAQVQPQAPARPETLEAQLARLQAENEALKNARSAVGAPASPSPWNGQNGGAGDQQAGDQQAGITYQG